MDWNKILSLAIPAGTTAVSAILGYNASKGAAQTQTQAAQNALAFEEQMFATQQGNLAPYLATGREALNTLLQGLGLAPFNTTTGAPQGGGGAAPAPYSPNSPYGSPLLGNVPKATTGGSALGTATGIGGTAATGAALGSFGGPIGTGVGAAVGGVVGTLNSLLGSGRKKENATVAVQNQVAAEVDRITKAVNNAQQNGTLTKTDLQQALDTVKGLQSQFGSAVQGMGTAGKNGITTLAKYFDPMTSMWQDQIDGKYTNASNLGAAGSTPDAQGNSPTPGFGPGQTVSQWNFAAEPTTTDTSAAGGGAPGTTTSSTTSQTSPLASGYFTQTPDAATLLGQDPGYQSRLAEGQRQLDRFFATRGLGTSGGAAKSAAQYGQTFASNEYSNAYNRYQQQKADTFNRLATLAGLGQAGTGTAANLATSLASSGGNLITDIGQAQAAGQVGSTNAITGALTGGANLYTQAMQLSQIQNYLNQNRLPATPTTTAVANPASVPGTPQYTGLD